MFYEIHGDRVPQFGQDRQLFEYTIRLVVQHLGMCTVHTGGEIRFHNSSQVRTVEIPLDAPSRQNHHLLKLSHQHWQLNYQLPNSHRLALSDTSSIEKKSPE